MSRRQISTLVFGAAVICTAIGGLTLVPVLPQSMAGQDEDPQPERRGTVRVDADEEETPDARYRRLIEKKLKLMTPEEVMNEIEKLRRELADREAYRKLDTAKQELQELIDQHPNSHAAHLARQMLHAGNRVVPAPMDPNNPNETYNPSDFEVRPVPDPADSFDQPAPARSRRSNGNGLRPTPSPYPTETQPENPEESGDPYEQRRKPNISPEQFRRPRNPKVDHNS